jgi:hypothetical protein
MKKLKTPIQLKKQLDKVFSVWIRMQGHEDFNNSCYTCGKYLPIKKLQCGHFIGRRQGLSIRWEPRNCKPQCLNCNVFLRGNLPRFAEHLMQEYGPTIIADLNLQSEQTLKLNRENLIQLINQYS